MTGVSNSLEKFRQEFPRPTEKRGLPSGRKASGEGGRGDYTCSDLAIIGSVRVSQLFFFSMVDARRSATYIGNRSDSYITYFVVWRLGIHTLTRQFLRSIFLSKI